MSPSLTSPEPSASVKSVLVLVISSDGVGTATVSPVVTGAEEMIGSHGQVIGWTGGEGRVRVHGEIWQASAAAPLRRGQTVRVTALRGLTLEIEPSSESGEE